MLLLFRIIPCMRNIIVIGYGNIHRGDDGVGALAAHALESSGNNSKARIITSVQLGPEHADDIQSSSCVIFIDASADDAPGVIRVRRIEPDTYMPLVFSHHMHPASLLSFTRAVYGQCPEAYLVTAGGKDFSHTELLSEEVKSSFDSLVGTVALLAVSLAEGTPFPDIPLSQAKSGNN